MVYVLGRYIFLIVFWLDLFVDVFGRLLRNIICLGM